MGLVAYHYGFVYVLAGKLRKGGVIVSWIYMS